MGGDNVLNAPGLMDPSTEFGSMMQHAMKIKGAQMEQDRKKFEVWPQFLQNSMWERNETTLKLRELPPAERLQGAAALKDEGNELFKKKKYTSAVELYEAAVGSFVYAKQLDPDWKKKGIKDETIELIDERGDDADKEKIEAFLVSCYNNLAACYLGRASSGRPEPGGSIDGDYKLCVQASTAGINIAPSCKALYRRARGLCEPLTSTDDDVDAAIRDLVAAASAEPEDKAVRQLLTRLRQEKKEKKEKERTGMAGMFAKGELYDKATLEGMAKREESQKKALEKKSDKARTPEECEREQAEAMRAVEHLRGQGRHADADSLEAKVREHQGQLNEYKRAVAEDEERAKRHDPTQIDYSDPTPEQVEDAKKHGIDLFDPMVRQELQRLQQEKIEEEEDDGEEGEEGDSEGDGRGSQDEDDVPASYRGKMQDRVKRMKRGQRGSGGSRGLGSGAVGSMEGEGGPSGGAVSSRTRMMIMAVAFAVGIYRIWAVLGPALLGHGGAATGRSRASGMPGVAGAAYGGGEFTELQHDEV
jgi:hypothetical protein